MADQRAPHVTPPPAFHGTIQPPPREPGPATRRAAVQAARTVVLPPPHATVYTPWNQLLAQADARFKVEISTALAELEQALGKAGQLLDTQYQAAAESAAHLEDAAYTQWRKLMAAADDTRNRVLGNATAAYDQVVAYAQAQYERSLADAEVTYKSILADAQRAQADAKSIVAQLPA